jgi:class 3 adenylate cyclase
MDGAKEQAVGVAIRLEGANGEEAITPLLTDAQKKGARVYTHGEHHVVLFSPRLTRSVNPEMLAIRLAKDAEQALAQHNQKSKQKARFGVGAARGEIISEMKNGEFSFTATTSFIPSAKRLASSSDAQTLVSHELYTMIMGNVKAEKARNVDAWRVLSLKDRGTHDGFIAGFLKRQE